MKTTTFLVLIGLTTAIALPAPDADPKRILPPNWSFEIAGLKGPGCPDFGKDPASGRVTRTTYGQNTIDGSEIYYWFVAYPAFRVSLSDDEHTWCETELSYKEFKDVDEKVKGDAYRLRLHKNGTRAIATYDLDEGVKATWQFTYDGGRGKEIVDEIEVQGPYQSGQYAQEQSSTVEVKPELSPLPQCGAGTFKFRTDLYVKGTKGKKGVVASEIYKDQYYGAQQGFSYDWEKCFTSDV